MRKPLISQITNILNRNFGVYFRPAGDSAVTVVFGNEISPEINARARRFCRSLEARPVRGVVESAPAYCSALVYYDPAVAGYTDIVRGLKRALNGGEASGREKALADEGTDAAPANVIRIPVCYGGRYGEDLRDLCALRGLSQEEAVARHCANDYLIYMLGFLPGFAYLGGLDPALAAPRLATPRLKIPAGSIGIGGSQTGIYPMESPGGWRIIGRTPIRPYDPDRDPPVLYGAGDYIRFEPIGEDRFRELEAREDV